MQPKPKEKDKYHIPPQGLERELLIEKLRGNKAEIIKPGDGTPTYVAITEEKATEHGGFSLKPAPMWSRDHGSAWQLFMELPEYNKELNIVEEDYVTRWFVSITTIPLGVEQQTMIEENYILVSGDSFEEAVSEIWIRWMYKNKEEEEAVMAKYIQETQD